MGAHIVAVHVGMPAERPLPLASGRAGPPLTTAIFKEPVDGPVVVGRLGAAGDGVGDTVNHGGPDKALCAYVVDHLPMWSARLDRTMAPGAFGENLSLSALDETDVAVGDVFAAGTAVVQVSQPRAPCATLARRWGVHDMVVQVRASGLTGWYFRVLQEGVVEAGDSLTVTDRPHPAWTIARCNAIAYGLLDGQDSAAPDEVAARAEQAAAGAGLAHLSVEWQQMFRHLASV